jgi:succinoglycan biosynthesis transport protein ExoP
MRRWIHDGHDVLYQTGGTTIMEPTSELRRYYEIVRRRAWIVALIAILAVGGVAAQVAVRPPEYQADVLMLVTPQSAGLAAGAAQDSGGTAAFETGYRDLVMNDIIGLIHSNALLQRVADRTGVSVDKLSKRITVKNLPGSDFLDVAAQDPVPARAAFIANTVTQQFSDFYSEINRSAATSARKFIGDQLAASKARLDKAEADLAAFQLHTGSIDLNTQASAMVQKVLDLEAERDTAALDATTAQSRVDAIRSALESRNDRLAKVSIQTNPVIEKLRDTLTNDELQLASLRQVFTDQHPKVQEQLGKIAADKQQLRAEAQKALADDSLGVSPVRQQLVQNLVSAEVDATAARAKATGFGQILGSMESQMDSLPMRELTASRLQRDVRVSEALYMRLSSLYQDALIAEKKAGYSGQAAVVTIDPATVPDTPVSSRLPLKAGVAGMLGLVVGVAMALLVDSLDDRVRSPRQAEGAYGVPVLAAIPVMGRSSHRYLVGAPSATSVVLLAALVMALGALAGFVGLHYLTHSAAMLGRAALWVHGGLGTRPLP